MQLLLSKNNEVTCLSVCVSVLVISLFCFSMQAVNATCLDLTVKPVALKPSRRQQSLLHSRKVKTNGFYQVFPWSWWEILFVLVFLYECVRVLLWDLTKKVEKQTKLSSTSVDFFLFKHYERTVSARCSVLTLALSRFENIQDYCVHRTFLPWKLQIPSANCE